MKHQEEDIWKKAAEAIHQASFIYLGAGAGIGVDSGLPDFRGEEGFWEAYPMFRHLGFNFVDMANPDWFDNDPYQAWGFYGHRLNLYRHADPHIGFGMLRHWMETKSFGGFVFTSNVDGQFQKAGFDETYIHECHGSIHWLQSSRDPGIKAWPSHKVDLKVDGETCRALGNLPEGPDGFVARPNILMFGDFGWNGDRYEVQYKRMVEWFEQRRHEKGVVIEIGAGTAIPTVRYQCERVAQVLEAPMVRVNPDAPSQYTDGFSQLKASASDAITRLHFLITQSQV